MNDLDYIEFDHASLSQDESYLDMVSEANSELCSQGPSARTCSMLLPSMIEKLAI